MADDATDPGLLRRRVLQATTAGIATGAAGCLGVLDEDPEDAPGSTPPDDPGSGGTPAETPTPHPEAVPDHLLGEGPAVGLETVAEGLTLPTDFAAPDDPRDRLFVTDQVGRIHALERESLDRPVDLRTRDPFLDLTDRVVELDDLEERGLLGLAFHPAFPDDDRLFVRYSAPSTADYLSHVEVLAEFRAPGDRTRADPDSERILLEVPQPRSIHNSGSVAFGPDGYCYLTTGDGGPSVWDPVDGWEGGGSAQNTRTNLLGGVLRIDVDREDGDRPYGIPPDNPLADRAGHRGEYYAWGFRNPWGLSFDGEDCYVTDVGAGLFESVYRVEKGSNCGWAIKEGAYCYSHQDPTEPAADCPDRTPDRVRDGEPIRDPVVGYPQEHDGEGRIGSAVIGGYVYRGDAIPELQGEYVFGDWSARSHEEAQGSLFVASPPADDEVLHPFYRERNLWPIRRLGVDGRFATGSGLERYVHSFGTDREGELYVLASDFSGIRGHSGEVHRIASPGNE